VRAIATKSEQRSAGIARSEPVHSRRVWLRATVAAVVFHLFHASIAWAHLGRYDRKVEITDWNLDPVLLLNLGIFLWLYVRGLSRIWCRAGVGRVIRLAQVGALGTGVLALVAVLVTPVDGLGEQLAWVHMVQHMVLMTLAAPMIVLGAPSVVWLWGISPFWRQAFGRLLRLLDSWRIPRRLLWQPIVIWSAYAAVMWVWHIPVLYESALRNPFVHDLQHLTFFIVACLFWRVILDPISRFRIGPGVGVFYLFMTTLQATVLGVWMTLAPSPWYGDYLGRSELWGLTPLEDQQLAGLIMWMPACLPYLVGAVVLIGQCLRDDFPQSALARRPPRPREGRHQDIPHSAAGRSTDRPRLQPAAEAMIR
jgi:putative membrane protein